MPTVGDFVLLSYHQYPGIRIPAQILKQSSITELRRSLRNVPTDAQFQAKGIESVFLIGTTVPELKSCGDTFILFDGSNYWDVDLDAVGVQII